MLSIKITIYRLTSTSKIWQALCRAVENGKEVLAQSGWERHGYWLHPLLELGLLFPLPGIVIGIFTQRCPFCGKFLGIFFFAGKKGFCPYCGAEFDKIKDEKGK